MVKDPGKGKQDRKNITTALRSKERSLVQAPEWSGGCWWDLASQRSVAATRGAVIKWGGSTKERGKTHPNFFLLLPRDSVGVPPLAECD